jgi:two-component system, cell cycle sensor histidine kinase and response regulator CckA
MPGGGRLAVNTRNANVPLSVAAGQNVRAGDYIVLAVSDTGAGMRSAILERIFDPFFTTKAPGKGTGFGLAVVYSIVRQSNGFMEVESVVGSGTTFRIYLPRLEPPTSAPVT